jgi:tetratricopeptide (TPR) repeat protein
LHRKENNEHFAADWSALKTYFQFWGSGKKAAFLEDAEKILESDNPGCLTFNVCLALIYIDLDQSESSFSLSQEYLNPDYQQLVRAQAYYHAREWRKAVNEFARFAGLDRDPITRCQLAECYLELGEWQKAIDETRSVQDMYAGFGWWISYPKTFYLMGKIYEKKGDTNLAVENYEKLLDLWKDADKDLPDLIDAKKRLAGLRGVL